MCKMERWMMETRIRQIRRRMAENREKMGRLIARREAFTSKKLIRLNLETTRLGYEAMELERRFDYASPEPPFEPPFEPPSDPPSNPPAQSA